MYRNKKLSSVSFFCPAYNDEKNLPNLIPKVHRLLSDITDDFEIIIIEDKSPDKTGEVANELAREFSHVRVVNHIKNRGYGGALKSGFSASSKDFIIYSDGDNQYDVDEIRPYLHLLDSTDVLSGYVTKKSVSTGRKIQSIVYNLLVRILFFIDVKDVNCSLKIYKKEVLEQIDIKSNSAFIDTEMLIKVKRMSFRIKQFPTTHYERMNGLASGSKLNVIFATIWDMLKFRLGLL